MNTIFRIGFALLVIVACTPGRQMDPSQRGSELARKVAERLLSEYPTMRIGQERRFVDGTFGYLELVNHEPGKLTVRLAVDALGRVDDLEVAVSEFNARHTDTWGSIDYESARLLHEAQDDDMFNVVGLPRSPDDETLAYLTTIDPSAVTGVSRVFFSLRATKKQIVDSLSRSAYVQRAEVRRPGNLAKTAVSWPASVPQTEWFPSTSLTTGSQAYANGSRRLRQVRQGWHLGDVQGSVSRCRMPNLG